MTTGRGRTRRPEAVSRQARRTSDRPDDGRECLVPTTLTMTVAHPEVLEGLREVGVPDGVRLALWDIAERPELDGDLDIVVVPNYGATPDLLRRVAGVPGLRLVQLPSAGYEHALAHIPEHVTVCNGRGVHDAGTVADRHVLRDVGESVLV